MMNKYLKSHITAAAFCAGVLLAVSCSTSREPRTMRLFMQSGRPNIFLRHEERTFRSACRTGGVHHFFGHSSR